ncbi:MAG: hypothetical protein RR500_06650 [Bacilli bacterium]
MKSMFFLANIFEKDLAIGITKKIHQQIDAFHRLGYENIIYTGYLDDGVAVFDNSGNIIKFKKYTFKNKKINSLTKNYDLKMLSYSFMKEGNTFDLIYSRYIFFDMFFLRFLKEAKKRAKKIVVEAHCYPVYEKGNYMLYPVYFLDSLYIKSTQKYIDVVAAISDVKKIWGLKTVNFDNGIDLSKYKLKKMKKSQEMNIIFVGYEYIVHGLDRLLYGLNDYYKNGEVVMPVKVHLVGKFLNSTIKLVDQLGLKKYVIFEGIKFGEDLDDIFDDCDIAVGVLAAHRKNSTLGTGLKTKEYFARGIPFIIAGESLNLDRSCPYVYRCPLDESNINILEIIEFYDGIKNIESLNEKIRNLAKNMTWDNEISKILDALE